MVVTLLVPAYEKNVDALPIPPQHNCAETASGLYPAGTLGWIDSISKPAAKTVPFKCPRSANLCKNRLIRWPGVSDRATILSEY
jgi:hypothetical protein